MESRKFISLLLVIVIICSIVGIKYNSNINAADLNNDVTYVEKMDRTLQILLDGMKDDELIQICVWIEDIDHNSIKSVIMEKYGLSDELLIKKSNEIYKELNDVDITGVEKYNVRSEFYNANQEKILEYANEVDEYIFIKRELSREVYKNENQEFIEKNIKNGNIIFCSQYAPMIICEVSKKTVIDLDKLDSVVSLHKYVEEKSDDEGNVSVSVASIGGNITRDTYGFNGLGVKIGQIESGRPETNVSELASASITRMGTNNNTYHASIVASIMVGSEGMAPQAQLYSTTADNYYSNAESLISSGVNVINQSNGLPNSGTYDTRAQWVDHIVSQHNVTWIKSAGNGGVNDFVTSPGNAYNVITVGGIDDNGTVNVTDDVFYTGTSCEEGTNLPSKPDVLAPAVGFSVSSGEEKNGTSFAAPHVTGLVAQMMSFNPSLKLRPDSIKAVILASCDRKETGEELGKYTEKEGVGVINSVNAVNSISNVVAQETNYTTTASSFTFSFYPLSSGYKTIALSWLRNTIGTGTNHLTLSSSSLANFNLYVYDSSGNPIVASQTGNPSEIVRFFASSTMVYTVKIVKFGNSGTLERVTLAHVR